MRAHMHHSYHEPHPVPNAELLMRMRISTPCSFQWMYNRLIKLATHKADCETLRADKLAFRNPARATFEQELLIVTC